MDCASEHTSCLMAKVALKIMSFNIWLNGGRSLDATIDIIRCAKADVVGLQECQPATGKRIAALLQYNFVAGEHKGNVILSRFPIVGTVAQTEVCVGASLQVAVDLQIHVFNAHLYHDAYGPYSLQHKVPIEHLVEKERATRGSELDQILTIMTKIADAQPSAPMFLIGDFNAPSHLDYEAVPWPTSLACEKWGLVDSYRYLYAVNRKCTAVIPFRHNDDGVTWTPIPDEEPHDAFDRIDFIYFAASAERRTHAVDSLTIDQRNSGSKFDWPSDHRAVVTRFHIAAVGDDI